MTKYHRTMDQAFPHGPDYGCAIKRVHKTSTAERVLVTLVNVGCIVGVFLAMLAYFDVLVP